MHKIVIKDLDTVSEAILWCRSNVKSNGWNILPQWPASGFVFSFDNIQDASWFGLKWVN